ncbi:MAG: hypothetical protein NT040_12840 [Bacteroidetes bacterium]|nr:hypothetical protein [Bacteroidota bacterium]
MKEYIVTSDWIDRYHNDELDEEEKAVFEQQMLDNPLLRSEVFIDAGLERFLMDAEVLDLMKKLNAASRRNAQGVKWKSMLLMAASVLCLAMTAGLYYVIRSRTVVTGTSAILHENRVYHAKENRPGICDAGNSTRHRGGDVPFLPFKWVQPGNHAENFEPLDEFELLAGSVTRSGQINLVSPGMNDTVPAGSEVLFAWRNYDLSASLSIIIMNNRGELLSGIPLHHASSYLLNTKGFMEGLYYWKIVADEDLVLMGRLTILK